MKIAAVFSAGVTANCQRATINHFGECFDFPCALSQREGDAQLRLDFAAFAQRCFRELCDLSLLKMPQMAIIALRLAGSEIWA
jgi:hypothetical protein